MKVLRRILALALALALLVGMTTVYAVEADENKLVLDHVPTTDFVSGVSPYDGVITSLSSSEAQAAGVPTGYTGNVTKVAIGSNSAYAGITIDPSSLAIPVSEIEAITFRVYLAGGTSLRVSNKGAGNWAILATVASNTWVDYTVKADGTGFASGGMNMSYFADSNGNLGVFGMGAKNVSSLYIDSITIVLSENSDVTKKDTTPPVISYSGEKYVRIQEGEEFTPGTATAYDEYDSEDASLEYAWSQGAFGSDGKLTAGTHKYTIKATDKSGNSSTLVVTVTVEAFDPNALIIDSLPVVDYIPGVSPYDGNVTVYSAPEAENAEVPKGYEGNVIKVTGSGSYTGVTFDFSGYNIPIGVIDSITLRFYFTSGATSLRVNNAGTTSWIVLADVGSNAWIEYTLGADGRGFASGKKMLDLADENGNLGIFGMGTKYGSGIYVDSIVIRTKEDNREAPVLNYDGETDVLTSAGKPFDLGITAYDEFEARYVEVEYSWSAGALDSDGNMLEGEHTCVVSAKDYYGNSTSISLNVTVGPPDVEAPEILFTASEIYVPVGTFSRMVISCVDNYDKVNVVSEWSDGAIDFGGRLFEGTHTLTLTATDLSGNKSVHVVTVYVTDGDTTVGELVKCGG